MRNRTENQITLVFIRHGETQSNREHKYLGKSDESLSENGIEMLRSYKKQGIYPCVDYLFSSPMKRCTETAAIIYPGQPVITIPEWREIDFGRFEHKNYEMLKEDAQYQAWLSSGGTLDFPEGESRADFIWRCGIGFIKMCSELGQAAGYDAEKSVSVGMVVHGGTIMALLSLYEGGDYFDYQVQNGRGYICSMTSKHRHNTAQEDTIRIKVDAKL